MPMDFVEPNVSAELAGQGAHAFAYLEWLLLWERVVLFTGLGISEVRGMVPSARLPIDVGFDVLGTPEPIRSCAEASTLELSAVSIRKTVGEVV